MQTNLKPALAGEARPTAQLRLEYLMTLHAPAAGPPYQVDASLAIYHTGPGGWARGPEIEGEILAPTADWLRIMPGGSMRVDARMMVKTGDGGLIHVTYGGVISVTQENFMRMAKGDILTPADMYFVISPSFQTSHPKYGWLNHAQALGKVAAVKGGEDGYVQYDVFAVK